MASDDEWHVVRHLQPQWAFIFAVMWVKQCHKPSPSHHHEFIGGMVTIPIFGWFMGLFYPHYIHINSLFLMISPDFSHLFPFFDSQLVPFPLFR